MSYFNLNITKHPMTEPNSVHSRLDPNKWIPMENHRYLAKNTWQRIRV